MFTQNKKWNKIDKENETIIINDIKFIRPIDSFTISIDCPKCKILISTIEDCESMKKFNLCQECSYDKSFNNKDNN